MYFELKVFETGRGRNLKTKIQFNASAPFTADGQSQIKKIEFDPKKVRDVLHFVTNELIPRLVIKANENLFKDHFDEQLKEYQKHFKGHKKIDWDKVSYNKKSKSALKQLEEKMIKHANKLVDKNNSRLKKPDITQFNFDELSPALLTMSLQTIVNSNVPPGTRK